MTALELRHRLDHLVSVHGDQEVAVVLDAVTGPFERLPFRIEPAIRAEGLAQRSAQVYFALVPVVSPLPALKA